MVSGRGGVPARPDPRSFNQTSGNSGLLDLTNLVANPSFPLDGASHAIVAKIVREANDMMPIYEKTRRYLLLEKVTVRAQHREGGAPTWRLSNPQEQHAIGVHVWRGINGAWVETLWHRRNEAAFAAHRVRMIDEEHRWPGFPKTVELYHIIGEPEREKSNFDVEDVSRFLLGAIVRAEKDAGVR